MTLFDRARREDEDECPPAQTTFEPPPSAEERLIARLGQYQIFHSGMKTCHVFVNSHLIRSQARIDQILASYRNANPDRPVRLVVIHPNEMQKRCDFENKKAVNAFRQRGYAASNEFNTFGRGSAMTLPKFVERNQAAADHQLTLIASHYLEYNPNVDWRKKHNHNLDALEDILEMLSGEGYAVDADGVSVKKDIHLVRRGKLYLPATLAHAAEAIAPSYCRGATAAMISGQTDRFNLTLAQPKEITSQVRFEFMHSQLLFSGATSEALLLWQMQVLAYLRIAAWQIDLETSADLFYENHNFVDGIDALLEIQSANDALDEAISRLRGVRHGQNAFDACVANKHFNEDTILTALEDPANQANSNPLREAFAQRKAVYDAVVNKFGRFPDHFMPLSANDSLICAFHGSTWSPTATRRPMTEDELRECWVHDPYGHLRSIAFWIGQLKRHRYARIDSAIVSSIKGFYDRDVDGDLAAEMIMLEDRLCADAWRHIVEAVDDIIANPEREPIDVTYEWTPDFNAPRSAARDGDTITIRGPLLDFPTSEAARWNGLAARHWNAHARVFWPPQRLPR